MKAWQAIESDIPRIILLWHRRAGKDSICLNRTVISAVQRTGLYWHVFPTYNQGKKIIWDGMTKEGRKFLDFWPPELVKRKVEDEMKIELKNGSIWQVVGTDNIDNLVGSNPVGVVMSEYALQDPQAWRLLSPILAENGGWAMFPYTPRGRNHGWDLFKRAQELMVKSPGRWFVQSLTVDDTQAISPSMIQEERDQGIPEETIQQEYWVSFDAALVGSYFGDLMKAARETGRIGRFPWEPSLPVNTWWDIGRDDATAIWFSQNHGNKVHCIDYYEKTGKDITWFAKILRDKPYVYGEHIGPHDINNHDWSSNRSRIEVAKDLSIPFRAIKKHGKIDSIHAARVLLPRCYFDEYNCARGIECLVNYHKEWDEEKKVFREKPDHDWSSNGSDAFQTGGLGQRVVPTKAPPAIAKGGWNPLSSPLPDFALDDYDYFGRS